MLGACANEMGLNVPGNPQPVDPLAPEYRPAGQDLTRRSACRSRRSSRRCRPPKFVRPDHADKQDLADSGRKLFHSVGCTACHVESIGPVKEIFSDLLLHDLGPGLADPVDAAANDARCRSDADEE